MFMKQASACEINRDLSVVDAFVFDDQSLRFDAWRHPSYFDACPFGSNASYHGAAPYSLRKGRPRSLL